MKICLITDQHFGARNDSTQFLDYFEKFYMEQFFPYLDDHKIDHIIDLGDTFDRRKYINFSSLDRCKRFWFDQIEKRNIKLDVIVGNHCTYFKNTNEINSPNLLLNEYTNMNVYADPTEVVIDGLKIAILPWVCSGNYEESMNFIKETNAEILFGHLEIAGFEMYKGSVSEHGLGREIFSKFDMVMSGHFHHKSNKSNIYYLGAPYEMTWSDWNDPRGFHIFDTDTRELTYIENRYKMFHKMHYDDSLNDFESVMDFDEEHIKDSYVKLIIHNKNNPAWFDLYVDKIENVGVLDLQIVEDHLHFDIMADDEIVDEAQDTLSILKSYSAKSVEPEKQKALEKFLTELYSEAITLE